MAKVRKCDIFIFEKLLTRPPVSPFLGLSPSNVESLNPELELIDGGTNGENIPLNPLLVNARALDTIVAVDASADTAQSWPKCVVYLK